MKPCFLLIFLLSLSLAGLSQSKKEFVESGNTKMVNHDYLGAIRDYNQAIELDPDNSDIYFSRGFTKMISSIDGAEEDFKKTIELKPNHAKANYFLGLFNYDNKKYLEAVSYLDKAYESSPEGIETDFLCRHFFVMRGKAKLMIKDFIGAMQDLNKAVEKDPADPEAFMGRGAVKFMLEDYRGAIQDYNKAILIDPKHTKAYLSRGLSKYFLSDLEGACLDWSKAGELGDMEAYEYIKKYCNN